jgi:hypothetical protein
MGSLDVLETLFVELEVVMIIPLWKALSNKNIACWPDVISGLGKLFPESIKEWMPVNTHTMVAEGKKYKFKNREGNVFEFVA